LNKMLIVPTYKDFFCVVMNSLACLRCANCLRGSCSHLDVTFIGGDCNYHVHPVSVHRDGYSRFEEVAPVVSGMNDFARFRVSSSPMNCVEFFSFH